MIEDCNENYASYEFFVGETLGRESWFLHYNARPHMANRTQSSYMVSFHSSNQLWRDWTHRRIISTERVLKSLYQQIMSFLQNVKIKNCFITFFYIYYKTFFTFWTAPVVSIESI